MIKSLQSTTPGEGERWLRLDMGLDEPGGGRSLRGGPEGSDLSDVPIRT